MKQGAKKSGSIFAVLITAAIAATAPFALNACTNNAAPVQTKTQSATTTYNASFVRGNPLEGLRSAIWQPPQTNWMALSEATHENKKLPTTKVACVYDANNLYVAFAGLESAKGTNSQISVWVDCSAKQNGTELMEITTDASMDGSNGIITVTRHRSVKAPEVRETPDFALPMDHIAETTNFLKFARGKTVVEKGKEGWSVVMAIPFRALHFPPNFTPSAGFNWRFNLLRTDKNESSGEVVQANLSPVHAGAQQVMPYRMATMTLAKSAAAGAVGAAETAKPARVALSR